MKKLDLTGKRFGKLIALSRRCKNNRSLWDCVCDCGNTITVQIAHLRNGHTRSCGCMHDIIIKHGKSRTPEYRIWLQINQRCKNPKNPSFHRYGGRGITVSEAWKDFENFISDMGERPTPQYTIERVDNNKGYSKENCKWATRLEQSRNHRVHANSSTGVNGVYRKADGWFFARIKLTGKSKYLGRFPTIEDARDARKRAELLYWNKQNSHDEAAQ